MTLLKKFVSYYIPHWRLFTLDLVCALLMAACSLIYPSIVQSIIKDYVPNENMRLIVISIAVLFFIYICRAAMNYMVNYWGHVAGVRVQADMRSDFFRHLQKLPFTYFDENKTGSIMSRIVNDLFEVAELSHHGLEDIVTSLITLVGAFVLMSFINIWMALIAISVIPFMILFAVLNRRNMSRAFKKSREKVGEINAALESSISGIRVSKAYTANKREIEKLESSNGDFIEARKEAYRNMGIFHSGMCFFNDLLYLIVLSAGALFFFYKRIDVADYAAFILYVGVLLKPIQTIVNIYQQLQDGMTGFKRFQEIMSVSAEYEPANPQHLGEVRGDILYDDITFHYQSESGNKVLKNLTMKIDSGKNIALVGPSGGGKTTICNLLPRFYQLESGKITIDGVDIANLSSEELRRNIGIVAQDVFLFNGTIRENIAYGRLDASDEEIIEAAKKANIHDFIMGLEKGYSTSVGERGIKLSGGQKQRISIARIFLKNPPILILDEATSALDNMTEMQIQSALSDLSRGRTCITVAHRLSTIRNADEIIVVTSDGISERGSHDELMAKDGIYKGLYLYQFKDR